MDGKDPAIYGAYSVYGSLLTEKQREMFEDYYGLDLSLGEIAEIRGVSRQAVKDALFHAERQLAFYEERLGFCSKRARIAKALDDDCVSADLKQKIEDIMEGR